MQIIVPAAGYGTRLRPHTFSKPKPLFHLAGKPVLGHILDNIKSTEIEELVFIIGYLGEQIKAYVRAHYEVPSRFLVQKELLGQAHALYLARELVKGPLLILFVDTLVDTDFATLAESEGDGTLLVKRVADPRRFGVVDVENGIIRQLIEKPDSMENDLAMVGAYYVEKGEWLMAAIDELLTRGQRTKGEYYLADALQIMIEQGAQLRAREVSVWEDCGKPETLLQTHRYLLDRDGSQSKGISTENTRIVPPVHIAPSARIIRSIIGPYVSIGEGCLVSDAIIRDSILDNEACIESALIEQSLIASHATVRGSYKQYNVGSSAQVKISKSTI